MLPTRRFAMDGYRKRRFAKNLSALLTSRNVTLKEAAEGRVPYQWLRRAVTDGISRPDKRSRDHLDALIRYFGLDGVDRLWDRDLYVPPPPSSIKHEADRLAELMREYVLAAGAGDEFLRQIAAHLQRAVVEERERQRRISEELERQRRLEERHAKLERLCEASGGQRAVDSWRERRDRLRLEEEERGREREERAKSFREAEERLRAASRVLDLFRLEVVERWRSVGLPRVEEVELTVAEVVALADEHRLKSPQELAPHISDLWLEKYAHVLGETPGQARDTIREFVSAAFGRVGELGTASGDEAGASSQDLTGGSDSDAVGSPWWRTSYVPPPPSSIKDEADRLGEEMRGYVKLVGEGDAVLQGIVDQIRAAVRAHGLKGHGAAPEASTGAGQSPTPASGPQQTVAEMAAAARSAIFRARQEALRRAADGDRDIQARPDEGAGRADTPGSGPSYPTLARQALDKLEAERLGGWRAYRLPRIGEVVVTPEELADHAGALGLTPDDLAGYALKVVWLPRYARVLGVTVDEATRFITDYLAGYVPGGGDGTAQPHPAQATSGAEPVPDAKEDAAEDAARAAARPLVAHVLGLLTHEQANSFVGAYPSYRIAWITDH